MIIPDNSKIVLVHNLNNETLSEVVLEFYYNSKTPCYKDLYIDVPFTKREQITDSFFKVGIEPSNPFVKEIIVDKENPDTTIYKTKVGFFFVKIKESVENNMIIFKQKNL